MTGREAVTVDAALLRSWPLPEPRAGGGKEHRGRVLVVAGSRDVPGAALLAGTAVLRAGAGKLQIGAPRSIAVPLGLAVPEAMVVGLAETDLGGIEAGVAAELAGLAARCQALLIGPGLVEDDETARLTASLLQAVDGLPVVVDAAAMMRLREEPDALRRHEGRVVVTPHAGEMAGILEIDSREVEADPARVAADVARDLGAVVVLKGGCSRIATPEGRLWACDHGNVGLATSGSGDTLAGFMAGLLGRGAAPAQAALWSVFLHGEAGVRLSAKRGPLGYLARELLDEIPAILADLCREPAG